MPRKQINIRVPSEILEKIDQKGKRSEVVRKAIEKYLSEGGVYQTIDKAIDKKIDTVIEGQKQMLTYLEEIKRFQPIINVNYPKGMLPQNPENFVNLEKQTPEKHGFWNRLLKRKPI